MRILVLGGTVFLSAGIVRRALAAGHEVTCLARWAVSAPPDGASWLRADRSEGAAAYSAACKGAASHGAWDTVVDVSRDPGQAREALEALAGSARHWTFISSCSVYADHSVAGADEAAGVLPPLPPGTELSAGNYGEAKAAIEHWTTELAGDKAHICRAGSSAARATARTVTGTGRPASPGTRTPSWSRTSPRTPPRSLTSVTSQPGSSPPPGTGPPGY